MDTGIDVHAISPPYTPAAAKAPSDLIECPTAPPIHNSDTPEDDQSDYTRWRSRNEKPTYVRFQPDIVGYKAGCPWAAIDVAAKIEELKNDGQPDRRTVNGWIVPHVQEFQETTNLQRVPKRLHDTRTGQVCAMSRKGGALEYATVSHVWDMTDGVDWSNLSRSVGEELSVPYVWVDKTCINQTDAEDKGQEIKMMAEYYSSAKHNVVIFSGFSMAGAVNAWKEEGMEFRTPAYSHAARLAGQLMRHRYFTRVWTMQELELARHNVLLMEDGWVDGHDLDNLLRFMVETWERFKAEQDGEPSNRADLGHMFCNCQRRKSLTSRQWQMSVREPLCDVWRRAKGRRCTNPKDIVWGIISLVKGGDRLKATYNGALSDALAELLALENCLGEVLLIRDRMSHFQDGHIPCWQPKLTGRVPIVMVWSRLENAQNLHFTVEKGALGATAYLLDQWHDGDSGNPILGGEELRTFIPPHLWEPHNRSWFVPILRNEISTKGLVLFDKNSEGNKIHKNTEVNAHPISTKALALATAIKVWIEGTGL